AADEARAAPRPAAKPKRSRRTLLIAAGALFVLVALPPWFFWPQLTDWLNPDAAAVSREELQASVAGERLARERVARGAENIQSGEAAMIGSTWAWGAGQLIAGAPAESRDFSQRYFDYLA